MLATWLKTLYMKMTVLVESDYILTDTSKTMCFSNYLWTLFGCELERPVRFENDILSMLPKCAVIFKAL